MLYFLVFTLFLRNKDNSIQNLFSSGQYKLLTEGAFLLENLRLDSYIERI